MTEIRERWFTADARALAVFRVMFGLLLLVDVYRRIGLVDIFYTADSVLIPPQPGETYSFSLLMYCDSAAAVWAFLGFTTVVALWLIAGWKTKLAQIAAFVCTISLHGNFYPNSGGDAAMNLIAFWTLFVPLNRAWSLDARATGGNDDTPVRTPVVLILLVQISLIYFFGGVNKAGVSWTSGEALHYALEQDSIVTAFAVWLRRVISADAKAFFTYATVALETLAPILILTPVFAKWSRRLVLPPLLLMHLGILATMNVGIFQIAMFLYYPFIWPREDLQRLLGSTPNLEPTPAITNPVLRKTCWAALAVLSLTNFHEAIVRNPWSASKLVAADVSVERPEAIRAVHRVLGMRQLWAMFSPDVATGEGRLLVVARFEGGRILDLLTGESPDYGPNTLDSGPGWNDLWRKYSHAVVRKKTDADAERLKSAIVRLWNEEHPDQAVLEARVIWVEDRSPAPDDVDEEAYVSATFEVKTRP